MKLPLLLALGALAAGALLAATPPGKVWRSAERWGMKSIGRHTIYNNIWGTGYGPQRIWAGPDGRWGVWADHPDTGGIKSYPNITRRINRRLSRIRTLEARVGVVTPSGGAWNSAFDIWDQGHKHEIMIWLNYTGDAHGGGNVKPISHEWTKTGEARPVATGVELGGAAWNVFRGDNGSNAVFSFLRTTKTDATTVDLRAILEWIRARGWIADLVVAEVQFGWEITSSPGGLEWRLDDFAVKLE